MLFGIIVDAKVIAERKYYVVAGNALAAIPMYLIATGKCGSAGSMGGCMFMFSTCH